MLSGASDLRQPEAERSWAARLRAATFAALYGPGARFYDPFTSWLFLGEWTRWQRTALALLPDRGLIVELGSGTGALARCGAGPERAWIGIEPSAAMMAVARRRLGSTGPWFVRGQAAAIPLPTASADGIVAAFPTPYILAETTAVEARRVLKRGGRLVVVLSGQLAPDGVQRWARRAALRRFYGGASAAADRSFSLPGFVGGVQEIATPHGTARVYVGSPVTAADTGSADGEATAHGGMPDRR